VGIGFRIHLWYKNHSRIRKGNRPMNEWYQTGVFLIALVTGLWKMGTDIKTDADRTKKEHEESVARVYERFDEFKKQMESTHVSKEVFSLTYAALTKDIGEIKSDVKLLLGQGKNHS
jgi:hypothetical protein